MRLFDSHAHVADPKFDDDRNDVINNMRLAGVTQCMLVCDPCDETPRVSETVTLSEEHTGFFHAVGIHPHNASCFDDVTADIVRRAMEHPKCRALGEIGLDYHYDLSPRENQREAFARQLDMAYELGKPAALHIREAFGDCMDILYAASRAGRLPPCQMHCFSGSWETAKQCLDLGMVISFSGSVTFSNGRKLLETARQIPSDRVLVETDSPYLAPVPMRGRRNEPAFVAHTARFIAELRGADPEDFAYDCALNSCRFFGIAPEAQGI